MVTLLGGGGADPVDRLLEMIVTGDGDGARRMTSANPGLVSQPLEWALVGSGEAPNDAPASDCVATVALLLDAGASLAGIGLDPGETKQPSAAVLELLRPRGLGDNTPPDGFDRPPARGT
jgi:hypothetical protein